MANPRRRRGLTLTKRSRITSVNEASTMKYRTPKDGTPPGGRAYERVRQFSEARGLPVEVEPPKADAADSKTRTKAKPTASRNRKRTRS